MNIYQISGALILGVAFAPTSIGHAQPTLDKMHVINPVINQVNVIHLERGNQTPTIKVLNMPSSLMAYWLDPMRQPKPSQIQISEANAGNNPFEREPLQRQPGNANGPRDLKLPPDVEIVASIDPQNVLLVKGSEAGVEALRKLVKEIDVPIGQVEIEAQIWEIAPAKLASLPLTFRDTAFGSEKTPALGDTKAVKAAALGSGAGDFFARAAFAAPSSTIAPILQNWKDSAADGSARLITAPRVTAHDGLTAQLNSTESRPLDFDEPPMTEAEAKVANDEDNNAPTPAKKIFDIWKPGFTFIESQTGFTVRPLLHGDVMNLKFQIMLNNTVTSGNTNMRDGQTLAIRLPNANPTTGWPRVALIKVHVIRRADDGSVVPEI